MSSFTIRDMENLCGIKAHTLRIWEQRYQILCPKRKKSNHRLYDSEDLKCLLRLSYLYRNGYKISALAKLSEKEICLLALAVPPAADGNEIFITQLLEASLDFDQDRFDKTLHHIILHMGFEKAITRVAFPFLEKIGLLWLTGHVVPAQEHFASALISRKLQVAIHGLGNPIPDQDKKVLIFAPQGEFHEMPLLYMHYLLKKNGTPTVFFGTNSRLDELKCYCDRRRVSHLYFHLVTNLLRCEPDQYIRKLTALFPEKQIVVSGIPGELLKGAYSRVRVLKSPEEMQAFTKES
jgi:MerR family transcriptional regulator, light-induced transcriptional regulator